MDLVLLLPQHLPAACSLAVRCFHGCALFPKLILKVGLLLLLRDAALADVFDALYCQYRLLDLGD